MGKRSPNLFLILFGLAFSGAGVVLLIISISSLKRERQFAEEGVTTSAVVVSKDTYKTTSTSGSGASRKKRTTTHYRLKYQFKVADRLRSGSGNVAKARWDALAPEAEIQIEYLPSNYNINRPAQQNGGFMAYLPAILMGTLACFFIGSGALVLVLSFNSGGWRRVE